LIVRRRGVSRVVRSVSHRESVRKTQDCVLWSLAGA